MNATPKKRTAKFWLCIALVICLISCIGASAVAFLGVFAPTQLPLAVLEGILTVMILSGLESYAQPELQEIGFLERGRPDR